VGSGFEIEQRTDVATCRVTLSLEHTRGYAERAAERSETAATASMKAFFEPRSVAVVGASRTRGKIGAEVLQNLIADGYAGRLFAVHPAASEISCIPACPRVNDVPVEWTRSYRSRPPRPHGRRRLRRERQSASSSQPGSERPDLPGAP
jgi:hypothetical protein